MGQIGDHGGQFVLETAAPEFLERVSPANMAELLVKARQCDPPELKPLRVKLME